jgi:hypothetical protein
MKNCNHHDIQGSCGKPSKSQLANVYRLKNGIIHIYISSKSFENCNIYHTCNIGCLLTYQYLVIFLCMTHPNHFMVPTSKYKNFIQLMILMGGNPQCFVAHS